MSTLTPADLAEDLQLSVYTVVEHLKSGRIPGGFQVVESGPWRVNPDVYRAWVAEKSAPIDPHRIEPRSPRARASRARRTA